MIIETILSSCNKSGEVNFAPIGIHIPDDCLRLADVNEVSLRLYPGSRTFSNLRDTCEGVINLTDDVLSFVDTALFDEILPAIASRVVKPSRMAAAKAILEFFVTSFDDSICPSIVKCEVISFEEFDSYSGLCRAQGAVLEAAIAATRLQWTPTDKILESWPAWRDVVIKTGGTRERMAFCKLSTYLVLHGIPIPESL